MPAHDRRSRSWLIGDVLEGEIYLACRVNLYRLCSDKYVSGYELDGELIVQTIEPAGFEVAISELGLGLKERNFNSTRTVVDTIEMVGVARMNDGIVLPSRWARNWFRSEVLGVQPNESVTPDPRTADTPKINTPPKFFAIPPVEPALEIVEPVRKAKVLTR